MKTNIIKAIYSGDRCITEPAYLGDYGMTLRLMGVSLPDAYEVHFSNSTNGIAKTAVGNADGCPIPDEYFQSGADVYAWLFVHTGEEDGETVWQIRIPVCGRSRVVDTPPTAVEQTAVTQTIAALNVAVNKAGMIAKTAAMAAETAETAATAAETSASDAEGWAQKAKENAERATTYEISFEDGEVKLTGSDESVSSFELPLSEEASDEDIAGIVNECFGGAEDE